MTMTSIIVPVYNIKNYLPRCIESLLAQSDPDFEVILVDDGSADGSGALCDAYAARDGRFRVVHKANGGLSSARNAGLDAARGEYILFLDGDDYLAPDAVQSLNAIAAAAGAFDFIQFRYAETDGSWQPGARQKPDVRICTDVREMFAYLYQAGGVAASACTKLYRAALFRGLRFREGIAHEDEQLLNSLLPRCRRVVYTDLMLYGYVMRSGSITHGAFNRRKLDVLPVMDERVAVLRELGYAEFVRPTQRRQFITAAMFYCQARRAHDGAAADCLRAKLRVLAAIPGLAPGGQYSLLYYLTKLTPQAAELYYAVRRVCGKS